jgi:tetratricopeptide (TPR) repeat protein
MNQLTLGTLMMPAANLGGENPLAPLRAYETASAASVGAGAADYPDRGREASILPYRLQDQYDRNRSPRAFTTAVLENQHLRATFLLDLGGRLWSLIDKASGRELLFVNPVLQPANLAVRDAWFSGGVEWNVSIIGHGPFTAAPLFAARVQHDDGTPILRLYEWDRIRGVPFQIDCWLADDRPVLMVGLRIINSNDHAIPMYWWSNIAVPERPDVRVLGPSDQAYRHDYDGSLVEHEVPIYQGVDVTYTTKRRSAADLYFRIPRGQRPWIAALDGEGGGLVHTSTDRLVGRKMFNWGVDAGGRRWQEFLSQPGEAYIEIQGGLAPTQGEYVAMPARTQWSWVEAYGLLEADRAKVHGADWRTARETVEEALERNLPRADLNRELGRYTARIASRAPAELLHQGSGWGALEQRRWQRAGEVASVMGALMFPESSLGAEQAPWIELLETGKLPPRSPSSDPGSLMVQPPWREMLEKSVQSAGGRHWVAWYHLGVMRYRAGDPAGARDAWERSLGEHPTAWAQRDLAVLDLDEGKISEATDRWIAAARLAPDLAPLAIECARALLNAGRPADLIAFTDALEPALRPHGRIRLLRAMAALALNDLDSVARYFDGAVDIANIREKETSLSDLWFGWQERRVARERGVEVNDALRREVRKSFPPPPAFDFRLNAEADII